MENLYKKQETVYGKLLDEANQCSSVVDFIENYKETIRYNTESLKEILEESKADPSIFDAVIKLFESLQGHGEYLINVAEMKKLHQDIEPEAQP